MESKGRVYCTALARRSGFFAGGAHVGHRDKTRDCTATTHHPVHASPCITRLRAFENLVHIKDVCMRLSCTKYSTPSIVAQTASAMPDPDCISIREQLAHFPGSKLGFVVYRLTYADDARWAQFMNYLNTRIRLGLEEDGDGDLFQYIDWDVQEDPALEDADEVEIRRYGFPYYSDESN